MRKFISLTLITAITSLTFSSMFTLNTAAMFRRKKPVSTFTRPQTINVAEDVDTRPIPAKIADKCPEPQIEAPSQISLLRPARKFIFAGQDRGVFIFTME